MSSIDPLDAAAGHRAQAKALETRYPGLRPGWVSADIAMEIRAAEQMEARALAEALDRAIEAVRAAAAIARQIDDPRAGPLERAARRTAALSLNPTEGETP